MIPFSHTRSAALTDLAEFAPYAGRTYEEGRNYDLGYPHNRVSYLSPYISRKILSEAEIIKTVLSIFSLNQSEKFVQEVLWGTYWRSWLHNNQQVWDSYRYSLKSLLTELHSGNKYTDIYQKAISARTGINCFDSWVSELISTGYLHNHTRMWFASIWIFGLKLPWQLGADFFFTHLLDADPASNTLGWRWVAGIQTKGKKYIATEENIKKFTGGRFKSLECVLDENLEIEEENDVLSEQKLISRTLFNSETPTSLLLFEEDLYPLQELSIQVNPNTITSIIIVSNSLIRQHFNIAESKIVSDYSSKVISSTEKDYMATYTKTVIVPKSVESCMSEIEKTANQIVLSLPRVGYVRDFFFELENSLPNVQFVTLERRLDSLCVPYSKKGFFYFKKHMKEFTTHILNS